MKLAKIVAIGLLPVVLVGCGPDGMSKQDAGLGIGAIAGGILGNSVGRGKGRIATTMIGAVVGGIVGSEIGRSLDREDRIAAQRAEYEALERGRSGVGTPWRNPDSGRYGEVVPGDPFRRGEEDCRPYRHTIYVDGRPETMKGVACRNPDGSWRNVS
ncbi:MAG: glycine zipper 2TM domain-containing protein [Hyphomicrobiaceae bacterium]|nr:glycine zipper 2TM domain-containing protein [Hyphomicrobiaceae bacterium]